MAAVAISVGCSKSARSFFFKWGWVKTAICTIPMAGLWQGFPHWVGRLALYSQHPSKSWGNRVPQRINFHHISPQFPLSLSHAHTHACYNQKLYISYCLMILPTSHSELPHVSSEVVCVSLLSCRLTGMAGPCWTPKRLILNNDFQTPEVDILVFMLSILRCKGVQVVLVPPSCLQLLLDAGEKEAYYIILLFFPQDRSGFIPTIWQSHLTLGNLQIFPGERTIICNTGGFLIATPPAVRWGFRYYMDVCL